MLAYLNSKSNNYYDKQLTIFPDVLTNTPKKFAINKRNKYMINRANYLLCYINQSFTNSFRLAQTAKKKNLTIINLGSLSL